MFVDLSKKGYVPKNQINCLKTPQSTIKIKKSAKPEKLPVTAYMNVLYIFSVAHFREGCQ